MWTKSGRSSWTFQDPSIKGKAELRQVEGGYKAVMLLQDTEFGMELAREDEFFQSRKDAERHLREAMDEYAE